MTRADTARVALCLSRAHRALWEAQQIASEDRTDDLVEDIQLHLRELERAQERLARRR